MIDHSGYRFEPSHYIPPLGHCGLEIELCEQPIHSRYAVHSVTFCVAASRLMRQTFHDSRRKNIFSQTLNVAIGNFQLVTSKNSRIFGFSFGGKFSIEDLGDYSVCRLDSSAPIFELNEEADTPQDFVIATLMALLARRQAAWNRDDAGFEQRLLAIEPFNLFIAGLATVYAHLSRLAKWGEDYRSGLRWVRRAIETLEETGEWPDSVPRLEELL
ncbi:MAG: hypothetical protein R6X18_14055 [Chloroflexota bacterium]